MLKHIILPVAFTAALAASALAATVPATISPDEFKSLFATGKPFIATSAGGKSFKITLKPDGTAVRVSARKPKSKGEAGIWRVSTKGYCSKWADGPERCYSLQKSGDGYDVFGPAGMAAHWKL